MPRSRDRHNRGIRGPLVMPNKFTNKVLPQPKKSRNDFFNFCVAEATKKIKLTCPEALLGIHIRVEEVPYVLNGLTTNVPLALAIEPTNNGSAQVMIFQRPLEHRADTRAELASLVHQTIIEQLAILTGRSISELTGEQFD